MSVAITRKGRSAGSWSLQAAADDLVDGVAERPSGAPGRRDEPVGHVIVECQCRSLGHITKSMSRTS
jgi:hypothetical protein